jgi:two-component sensor histidine kinase
MFGLPGNWRGSALSFREKDLKVINSGKEVVIQEEELTASDKVRYLFTKKVPIFDEEGKPRYLLGISEDITELKNALKEKDYLMKELNHRVKNNLAMVSSLINLKDSETEADLSDIKHQIEAISLIHEKLYQTEGVTEIGFRDYIGDLLSSIFSSFTTRQVKIEANIDAVSIPTKSAMSLGLIVNEIVTNAIQHGFTEKEAAVFSIKLEKDKEKNQYELTLSNTGNPFPKDIDIDNPKTLGLRLISALTEQLDGTIDLKRGPYPVFTIRFPIKEVSSI